MSEHLKNTAELREIKNDVARALVDIQKGARLIRDGSDVTEAHRSHLQALVADIDTKIAAAEDRHPGEPSISTAPLT